jgi:general secretion pathway protein I
LIEVLVALAIVAIGMSAVLGAMTSAADTALYLRGKTFAQWIALNRISELRLKAQLPPKGKTDGDVEFAGSKWVWHQEVAPLEWPGLWRIDVSVRPADVPASNKSSWYTTETGIVGDALDRQAGNQTDWSVEPAIVIASPGPGTGGAGE